MVNDPCTLGSTSKIDPDKFIYKNDVYDNYQKQIQHYFTLIQQELQIHQQFDRSNIIIRSDLVDELDNVVYTLNDLHKYIKKQNAAKLTPVDN